MQDLVASAQDAGLRFIVPEPDQGERWYKGNTHAHTLESDGDSTPRVVATWYRDHGYDFLVLSDHDVLTDPNALADLQDSTFLLIAGEEVTSSSLGMPAHVNGLNVTSVVAPVFDSSMVETLQRTVNGIRHADGAPHINHPNFGWSVSVDHLLSVQGYRLLEIYNGHPAVHNAGGGGRPSVEEMWDVLLTRDHRVYGIAVDDAHHFQGEFGRERSNPGRGWVSVRSDTLSGEAIVEALENGRFYASTGPELTDLVVSEAELEIRIRASGDDRFTTTFVGDGRIIAVTGENPARYVLSEDVKYVRARITNSRGETAWTQPVFTAGSAK
jgi:hypothetical protein